MVRICLALVMAIASLMPSSAAAHPIHMSFTEIRMTTGKSVELSVRVFADDFSIAAARHAGTRLSADSIIDSRRGAAYLLAKIRVSGKSGPPIRLIPCGVERTSDMLRYCFRAVLLSAGPVRVANSVMNEMFDDQVNVVQSITGKKRASRMFVRGDGWKAL